MLCGGRVFKKVKAKTWAFQRLELVRKAIARKHCISSIDNEPYVIDYLGRKPRAWLGIVPCLTRRHSQEGGYYLLSKARTFTIQELCQLQGLPASLAVVAERLDIQDRHLGAMVGNAVPAPLLRVLIGRMLHVLLGWVFFKGRVGRVPTDARMNGIRVVGTINVSSQKLVARRWQEAAQIRWVSYPLGLDFRGRPRAPKPGG